LATRQAKYTGYGREFPPRLIYMFILDVDPRAGDLVWPTRARWD